MWLILHFFKRLGFSFFLRDRNPISTRIELSCLGLLGLFWLSKVVLIIASRRELIFFSPREVLGVYLAKSDSQSADVECFASDTSTQPLADSAATCEFRQTFLETSWWADQETVHTDQYQAMYRVLNSFALINAVLGKLFIQLAVDDLLRSVCPSPIVLPRTPFLGYPEAKKGRRPYVAWTSHFLCLVQQLRSPYCQAWVQWSVELERLASRDAEGCGATGTDKTWGARQQQADGSESINP